MRRNGATLALTLFAAGALAAGEASPPTLADMTVKAGRQVFELAPTGLPAQIEIQAGPQELPLEKRAAAAKADEALLQSLGRGKQLRAPMRLEAVIDGKAEVAAAAEAVKPALQGDAVRCAAVLKAGALPLVLELQYRNGALTGSLRYGEPGAKIESLELVLDLAGSVDLALPGAVVPDKVEAQERKAFALGDGEGLVWGNAEKDAQAGGRACPGVLPQLFVGSGDRGFTLLTEPGAGWLADPAVSTATLERNKDGEITWRIKFVNHAVTLKQAQTVSFVLLVHPSRVRPVDHRQQAWLAWGEGKVETPPLALAPPAAPLALVRADAATRLEPWCARSLLVGPAGGDALSLAQDHIRTYPHPLFRWLAGTHTGLVTRLCSNAKALVNPGGDPAADRALLGRALACDVGLDAGSLAHLGMGATVVKALHAFGYFEGDGHTEFLPCWRSAAVLRFGEEFKKEDAFKTDAENPVGQVYVSVYVRPCDAKRPKPYKALIVLLNEGDAPVRDQLYVLQPGRLFGGANRVNLASIREAFDYSVTPDPSDWGKPEQMNARDNKGCGLRDVEDNGFVQQSAAKRGMEVYGPRVFIPAHSFRLLYGSGSGE